MHSEMFQVISQGDLLVGYPSLAINAP